MFWTNFSSSVKLLTQYLHCLSFLFGLVGWASSASFDDPPTTARAGSTVWSYPDSGLVSWTEIPHLCQTLSRSFSVPGLSFLCLSTSTLSIGFVIWTPFPFLPVSMHRSSEQRWSEQDHQRWRYHRRLLDYQSHDSHLKLPFVICTLGDHQYLWIIKVHIVIWNNFVTAIYLLHQRPHFLLKILLDHRRLGGSSKSLHSFETSCCWYQKWLLIASLHNAPAVN